MVMPIVATDLGVGLGLRLPRTAQGAPRGYLVAATSESGSTRAPCKRTLQWR